MVFASVSSFHPPCSDHDDDDDDDADDAVNDADYYYRKSAYTECPKKSTSQLKRSVSSSLGDGYYLIYLFFITIYLCINAWVDMGIKFNYMFVVLA